MTSSNADAPAAPTSGFSFERLAKSASRAMAQFFGAPPAVESGTAAPAPTKTIQTTETAMKGKVSSRRAASIAGRVLGGEKYTHAHVVALAGSVLSQKPKAKKKAKRPTKKRAR